MADTIEVDLTTALKRLLHDGLQAPHHRIVGLIAEVAISPEIRAALLAGDFGSFDSIVRPDESRAADAAPE